LIAARGADGGRRLMVVRVALMATWLMAARVFR
jgi:hypothetical protein